MATTAVTNVTSQATQAAASLGRKVLQVTVYGYDETVPYITKRIKYAAKLAGIRVGGPVAMPMKIKKWTLLKSPHIDKKARQQVEMRTKSYLLTLDAPAAVSDKFLKFIVDYAPESQVGTNLKVTEHHYVPLSSFATAKRDTTVD